MLTIRCWITSPSYVPKLNLSVCGLYWGALKPRVLTRQGANIPSSCFSSLSENIHPISCTRSTIFANFIKMAALIMSEISRMDDGHMEPTCERFHDSATCGKPHQEDRERRRKERKVWLRKKEERLFFWPHLPPRTSSKFHKNKSTLVQNQVN